MILLGVLAALVVGAVGFAAPSEFTLAGSPSSQTVGAGQAAVYSVTINRDKKFAGAVAFSVTGLPSGSTGSFSPVSTTANGTTLTVQTSTTTPAGTYSLAIKGVGGKTTQTTTVTLVVSPVAQPNFTVSASPSSRTVVQTDVTDFTVTVARSGGFTGVVALSLSGKHSQTLATFSPNPIASSGTTSTLSLDSANTPEGSYSLTITGSATIGSSTVTRTAVVTLTVIKNQGFTISGNAQGLLAPGGTPSPIDLSLTNPQNSALKVTALSVAIEELTSKGAVCGGSANFEAIQYAGAYPLTLPAGSTRTLSQLGVPQALWPKVRMKNLPSDQNACQNAQLTLQYSGTATK